MKPTHFISKIQMAALVLMTNFAVVWATAQEKAADLKVDVDLDKGGNSGGLMSNPILWIALALIVILIVALAARGGGNSRA